MSIFMVKIDYGEQIAYLALLARTRITEIVFKRQREHSKVEIDPDINEKKFPADAKNCKEEITVFDLLPVPAHASSEKSLEEISKHNFNPATVRSLLKFVAGYPELAIKHTIIALGSVLTSEVSDEDKEIGKKGFRSVPIFVKRGRDFFLELFWFGAEWPRGCKLLIEEKVN